MLKIDHVNFNVTNLEQSVEFYKEALGLLEIHRKTNEEKGFELVFLQDKNSGMSVELTWLSDHPEAYDLSDNEIHLALMCDDYKNQLEAHRHMGCVCMENHEGGYYFIEDPDGYWIEIVNKDRFGGTV